MNDSFAVSQLTSQQLDLVPVIAEFARAKWEKVRSERPYAFFLSSAPEGYSVCVASATERSLSRIASYYLNECDYHVRINADPMEVARAVLRWANPDDGWLIEEDGEDKKLSERLLSEIGRGVYRECDGTIAKLCTAALCQIDEQGVFGIAAERQKVTIGFRYYSTSNSELFAAIRKANPPEVALQAAADILRMIQLSEYFEPRE